MSVRGRFVLLTLGRLTLGVAAMARAIVLVATGNAVRSLMFPTLLLAFGVTLIALGVYGVRALRGRLGAEGERLISRSIAEVDRSAPSGLQPLWIGLLLVIGTFIAWVIYAGLRGA